MPTALHTLKRTLPLLLLPLLLTQCKWLRPDPVQPQQPPEPPVEVLPEETQQGLDTFGCLVNGQVWVPGGTNLPVHADYDPVTGQFFVNGKKRNLSAGINQSISIGIRSGLFSTGVFQMNNSDPGRAIVNNLVNYCTYQTDSTHTGQLEITHFGLDQFGNRIISGRFSFTVVTPGCDTLHVTNGRFDIRD